MAVLLQFIIGLIFGLGLIVSGMSNPAKVLNFLDFAAIRTGTWDASLAFVMAGAIAVTFIGFKLALKRPQPIFGEKFHLPTQGRHRRAPRRRACDLRRRLGARRLLSGPRRHRARLRHDGRRHLRAAMLAGMWLARFIARLPSSTRVAAPVHPLES